MTHQKAYLPMEGGLGPVPIDDGSNDVEGGAYCDLCERCACDLLRDVYPSLVPVTGGSDAGMDGAVAKSQGGHVLVATTAKDVIGNLTRNLTTYRKEVGDRNAVIAATSQFLTPKRRQNLEKRATELGFELVVAQIHDGEAIASLLYPRPDWCKELLGLTGERPPLSRRPRTKRPLLSTPLVGREDDRAGFVRPRAISCSSDSPGLAKWRSSRSSLSG